MDVFTISQSVYVCSLVLSAHWKGTVVHSACVEVCVCEWLGLTKCGLFSGL